MKSIRTFLRRHKAAHLGCIVGVAIAAWGPGAARANHCGGDVIFYTYSVEYLRSDLGSIGCFAGHQDTNWIVPGSDRAYSRVDGDTRPMDGAVDGSRVLGSWIELGADRHLLRFTQAVDGYGNPYDSWRSQELRYEAAQSVDPAFEAIVHVCFSAENCIDRIYRSVA